MKLVSRLIRFGKRRRTMHTMPQSKTLLRNCGKRDLANQLITHIYQIGSKQKKNQIGCSGSLFSVRIDFHLVHQNLRLPFNATEYEIRFEIFEMFFFSRLTISGHTLKTVYLLPMELVNYLKKTKTTCCNYMKFCANDLLMILILYEHGAMMSATNPSSIPNYKSFFHK